MKIVFFGSSDFSLHALSACLDFPHEVILVITTPDQKKGRGLKVSPTPVKVLAQSKGLEVIAPETLRSDDLIAAVQKLEPDYFVVSSYGKMIPTSWLKIPSRALFNVHPSLLPKYRGAAPINWPVLNGDAETGVSIAEVTPKLDAGDVFHQVTTPLGLEEDSAALSARLAALSYDVLKQVFEAERDGRLKRSAQNEALSTYARKLEKKDGAIDWRDPAARIARQVRGLLPWPGAFFLFGGEPVQVLAAAAAPGGPASAPGTLLGMAPHGGVIVQTGEGTLTLAKVRPAGRNEMTAADFTRGRRLAEGVLLEPGQK